MIRLFILLGIAAFTSSGCLVRRLQPPQYGTTMIQQLKVLGTKISVPSTSATSSGLVELYLGWVSESVIIVPTISNVDSNGVVSPNNVEIKTPPIATTFILGESVNPLSTSIKDDFITGWQGTNTPPARVSIITK